MINFYEYTKRDKILKNPNYKNHGIELPFRMCIASGSGTGKTNALCNLLMLMDKTFHKIIICVKCINEPLYEHLALTLGDKVEFYEDGEIPPMITESVDKKGSPMSKLIVFDDLLYDNQSPIKQFYIRGRKKFYSSIYISQSFHGIPMDIRKNAQYFILGRSLLDKDLRVILTSFTSNLTRDEFVRIYRQFTDKPLDVMLIDINKKIITHNINKEKICL